MAVVKPFRAFRPTEALAKDVAALPYDVYSREEAAEAVKGKPLSFLNIDRPETQFPPTQDMYAMSVYEKAAEMLRKEEADGVFVREDKPCYYVWSLTWKGRTQTGICALSSVDDYLSGVCKKHENTVAEKELDRIHHVDVCSAQTGPIFLCYRRQDAIEAVVTRERRNTPLYDFTEDDGVHHEVWRISDEATVEALAEAFEKVPNTYIADGHHRAASAVKVALKRREAHPDYTGKEEFNYFLSVLFPDSELEILPYNRVVKDLNGLKPADFMESLEEYFEVIPAPSAVSPGNKGNVGIYLDGKWFLLTLRDELVSERRSDPVKTLDVSMLQELVLSPMLGIEDPRTDHRIQFVGGIRGVKELEKLVNRYTYDKVMDGTIEERGPAVAFSMYPTSISELLRVADAGRLMPPKSTWFEPKLRSGLFIHEIER